MKLTDFDYEVPESLVAQRPLDKRDASRMLVLHRKTGRIEHCHFLDIPAFLSSRDTLVFNRSRVVKARLIGQRGTGGKVEIFLLQRLSKNCFECLVKATASKKEGLEFSFGDSMRGKILRSTEMNMIYEVELQAVDERIDFWIDHYGRVPLPPYIHREADGLDISRYQTIYAEEPGSVAAPTAGLHFTPEMQAALQAKGVNLEYVTLHVGLGTFQPIKTENIDEHRMHRESFTVSPGLKKKCAEARVKGERIVAVGTTSVRALESAARGLAESTDLFLRPGSEFLWVDALFTNFHQPKSSLVVMLSAFVGNREMLLEAYQKAVEEKYRFFSYGDCMLVL